MILSGRVDCYWFSVARIKSQICGTFTSVSTNLESGLETAMSAIFKVLDMAEQSWGQCQVCQWQGDGIAQVTGMAHTHYNVWWECRMWRGGSQ